MLTHWWYRLRFTVVGYVLWLRHRMGRRMDEWRRGPRED